MLLTSDFSTYLPQYLALNAKTDEVLLPLGNLEEKTLAPNEIFSAPTQYETLLVDKNSGE